MSVSTDIRMATEIDRYEMIAQLEKINGTPIAEIEKRSRPGQFACSGFIGSTENFKDVLQRDWKTVQALGITHIELAAQLKAIWNRVQQSGGSGISYNFSYRVDLLPNKFLQGAEQNLSGKIVHWRGYQQDIFDRDGDKAYQYSWDRDLILTNLSNNLSITVAYGVMDYIEKYGFYEGGGDQNSYRVDPLKLVAVLTGASVSELQAQVNL